MASWNSPRGSGSYGDATPTSPLTPLSPGSLPQWLRHPRPRVGILSNARVRLLAVALGCIILGCLMTAMLDDGHQWDEEQTAYDPAAAGVLTDPSGYGVPGSRPQMQPGIIGETENVTDSFEAAVANKKLSVSGALADLHSAVKDKISQWNPYSAKPDPTVAGSTSPKPKSAAGGNGTLLGELVTDGLSEEDMLGSRVRIGKCTILFNGNGFWERAIRTHERHNKEHGYRLHILRQHILDDVWSKPAYILSLILRELAKPESERLEWLLWVDADTIILNPYVPIDTFLPPPDFDDIHLMYSNDWNGLNNGVFPVRVNSWSAMLFSSIVAFRHYRPEQPLVFRDQSAMNYLMNEQRFAQNIVQTPQRWFNAYQGEHNETLAPYQIRRGDVLVHFAGVLNRDERMAYWLDRAEQHLDDWEIPVKSTSYLQEVRDFWNEQRDIRRRRKEEVAKTRLKASQLIDQGSQAVEDYGDRLAPTIKDQVDAAIQELRGVLGNQEIATQQDKIEEAIAKFGNDTEPLRVIIDESRKSMLSAAHQAIFGAEKDLIDGGWNEGMRTAELERISVNLVQLKNLVMSPSETWTKLNMITATNAVTEARVAFATVNQAKLSQENALVAIQKQVQAEADAEARRAGELSSSPQTWNAVGTNAAVAVVTVQGDPVMADPVTVWTTATTVVEEKPTADIDR